MRPPTVLSMSNSAIRVVIGEDNPVFAAGLAEILGSAPDITVVGIAGDRDALFALIAKEKVDVVLSDIRMPPTQTDEGMQIATRLLSQRGRVGVILLSQYVDPVVALAVFSEGEARRGYLLKERIGRPAQLIEAVRTVADGGSVVDPGVVEALIAARGAEVNGPLARLTAREMDVLRLVAQGCANQAIAEQLSVGRPAVEKNLTSIFTKLDLRDDPHMTNRRVSAALVYLAAAGDAAPRPPA